MRFHSSGGYCTAHLELSTVPVYGYDRILYGCMMGTDHMFIWLYSQKLRGQPVRVQGPNGQYMGATAKSIINPIDTNPFMYIEWD